jgi:hypothetical protein
MSLAINTGAWPAGITGDEEAIFRLQETLLRLVEGERDAELDAEYKALRQALLDNSEYADVIPRLIRVHRDLGGMWPYMKSFSPQRELRRKHVREELEALFSRADDLTKQGYDADPPWPGESSSLPDDTDFQRADHDNSVDASDWTGMQSRAQRLAAARSLLPVARASIERLIEELSKPSHNGGPSLDETVEAIDNLRKLHRALGEILEAIEGNNWSSIEGQGLPAEAAKYAKRFARAVRNDPIPYAASALLLGVLTACGFPGIAGYLTGVALTVRKGPHSESTSA